ncbi:MAG TPA: TonB family protein [Longimicrobiales bacterium]|nr:TonB family protein [Longimicrobiales bacterium]
MSRRDGVDLMAPSANQRLRDAWRGNLRRSTALAVAAHAALLAFSFSWRITYLPLEPLEGDPDRLLLLPGFGETATPGTTVAMQDSVPGELTEIEAESEAGLTEGPVVTATDLGDRWEALGERLRGRGAPLPMLSEPEIAPPEEDVEEVVEADEGPATDEEGAPSIDGDARTIGLAELPEPDSLSFDRLSALRPELAFMTASAWVLLRNQAEVEAFLRRGYRSGRLDPNAAGSVSVTLWIDRRGSVEWAEVSQSSGRNDLDEFTLALFNEVAAFRAAREQGVYVSRSVTFSVNYPW